MHFDVRLPIGLLFLAVGVLLAAYGLTADKAVLEAHSGGVNIDLIWGAVMAAFGAVMLLMAELGRRRAPPPGSDD
jgi:hypothetical protein